MVMARCWCMPDTGCTDRIFDFGRAGLLEDEHALDGLARLWPAWEAHQHRVHSARLQSAVSPCLISSPSVMALGLIETRQRSDLQRTEMRYLSRPCRKPDPADIMPYSVQRFLRSLAADRRVSPWLKILAVMFSLALGPWTVSATETPPRLLTHEAPFTLPEIFFKDSGGRSVTLTDRRGRVVVLNVWATWCSPCREEMPTLDRLQARFDRQDVEVVALSIDRKGLASVQKFFDQIGVKNLAPYIDESGQASRALGLVGLPGTLVIGRDGREIGRLLGGAAWDSEATVKFLEARLGQGKTASAQEPAL
jgi:thiol-disulfide isomerase/thioredoxin